MQGPSEAWSSGAAYEPYVGRWSRLVAAEFVDWLGIEPGLDWLDVGCGTGALTQTVLERADPASVLGVDPSPGYVAFARERTADHRARFRAGDAQDLPVAEAAVGVVVCGLVLNFVPDQQRALAEMRRVTRPGGVVSAYVWDYADGMQPIRAFWDAATDLDAAAAELDEGARFPLCRPGALTEAFRAAGFEQVEGRPVDVPTTFRDFADYWTPFLGGQGPAPTYVAGLAEETRDRLRDLLRERLTPAADGTIRLTARAWAARAQVPPTT